MIQDETFKVILIILYIQKQKISQKFFCNLFIFLFFSKIFSITKLQMNKSSLKDNESNSFECNSFCNKK